MEAELSKIASLGQKDKVSSSLELISAPA